MAEVALPSPMLLWSSCMPSLLFLWVENSWCTEGFSGKKLLPTVLYLGLWQCQGSAKGAHTATSTLRGLVPSALLGQLALEALTLATAVDITSPLGLALP